MPKVGAVEGRAGRGGITNSKKNQKLCQGGIKMPEIKKELESRKNYLEKIINNATDRLSKAKAEGIIGETVYACKHGKGYQYYKKIGKKHGYIRSSEMELVKKAVQFEYDTKILSAAKLEYSKLLVILNAYNDKGRIVESIYDSMPNGKKRLIIPDWIPDEEYIDRWKKQTYVSLGFRDNAPEFYSSKGERMRSKSEVLIANLFERLHVEYKYEKPLMLKRMGLVHPDFTILDTKKRKEIYWEHLGLMDDQVYRNNAIMKIRDYENSGFYVGDRLIVTEESTNCPLDIKSIEKKIHFILDC